MKREKITIGFHLPILGKSYKKGFLFPLATTLEDITNHSVELAKVFS